MARRWPLMRPPALARGWRPSARAAGPLKSLSERSESTRRLESAALQVVHGSSKCLFSRRYVSSASTAARVGVHEEWRHLSVARNKEDRPVPPRAGPSGVAPRLGRMDE